MVTDSYCELESKQIPKVASAIRGQGVINMETESFIGGATILRNDYVASTVRPRSVKRTAADPSTLELSHEDARREALRVLELAEAQHQVPYHVQQHAHHHQQAVDDDDESLGDTDEPGQGKTVQLKQASSLQQAAAKDVVILCRVCSAFVRSWSVDFTSPVQ